MIRMKQSKGEGMKKLGNDTQGLSSGLWRQVAKVSGKQGRIRGLRRRLGICLALLPLMLSGCGNFHGSQQARIPYEEADGLFRAGNYQAALEKYEQLLGQHPATGDRTLFEMGILYSYARNEHKDYQKALECFQKIVKEYPAGAYRQNSQAMIGYLEQVALKDSTIAAQQTQLDTLRQEIHRKEGEIEAVGQRVKALERLVMAHAIEKGSVDKILVEKGARRMTLVSHGEVLKNYRIALGGDPVGHKAKQGDNKTPEGTYVIDGRNKGSRYHLSLRISYPNDSDRRRARELGVNPGGDIMIHGIKNGFSWVGDAHAELDWTQGCIAVTNEEIEEINKLAPNGTIVEIRP